MINCKASNLVSLSLLDLFRSYVLKVNLRCCVLIDKHDTYIAKKINKRRIYEYVYQSV